MKKILPVMLIGLSILLIFTLIEGQKVRTVDGVTIVSNGKKPVKVKGQPASFSLQEELVIGQADDPEKSFSEVTALAVDDRGMVFALDFKDQKVKVFDSTGRYIHSIGKPGQGPGELGMATGLLFNADGMLLVEDATNRRLAVFKPTGEFVKNISFSERLGLVNMVMDNQGNILGRELGVEQDKAKMFYEIKKYDTELKPLFVLDRIEFPLPIPGSGNKFNIFEMISIYQFGPEGRIYYGRNQTYEIKIHSPEGKPLRTISRDYDRIKLTQKDIDEIMEKVPAAASGINLKGMYSFPEFFPPFQNFILDEQGRIYVRTYEKGKNKGEYWIDVFDPEGRFIAQFISKADLRLIRDGKAYAIEDSDEGYQVIKRYSLLMK